MKNGLEVVLLDVLEVAICSNLEFLSSSLVGYDDTVLVELKNRDCPHLCNRSLNSSLQSACLVVAITKNHNLASSHHSAYTNSESGCRNLLNVVVEETRVGNDSVGCQCLLACT